jgi:hypothetical protein
MRRSDPWTAEQLEQVRDRYPHTPTVELAAEMGRTVRSVYEMANKLGIKKTAAFIASGKVGRLDGVRGYSTRFLPGHATWNKGRKGLDYGKATRFKPGNLPHTTLPIGSYRITKDGTLQRKIGNAPGNNSQRWRGVHELVWVAAHGPVPPGHIVVFKPGARTAEVEEITLDKVECISWAENMLRNTRHNLPKPLNDIIGLRAALVRKINHRTKANERNHLGPAQPPV